MGEMGIFAHMLKGLTALSDFQGVEFDSFVVHPLIGLLTRQMSHKSEVPVLIGYRLVRIRVLHCEAPLF